MPKRRLLVTLTLIGLFAALGALLSMRDHGALSAEGVDATDGSGGLADGSNGSEGVTSSEQSATTPAGTTKKPANPDEKALQAAGAGKAGAGAGKAGAGKAGAGKEAPAPPAFDRVVRGVGLGWDLLVPGYLASTPTKAGEQTAFQKRRLEVALTAVDSVGAIKDALARGGADPKGADIAILPLPEMVAAYEDLRALEPHIFFVVGWSRGRDALYAKDGLSLLKPPKGTVTIIGEKGTSATLLAAYLLDLAGRPAKQLRVTGQNKKATFAALNRAADVDTPEGMRIQVTSADAPSLVPFVAIAPRGFLDNQSAVAAWVAGWLDGVTSLRKDVPDAARRIAAMDDSPEAVELVKQLGQVQFSGLTDNVRRAGLSGRDAVTLEELFSVTWRLWKDLGVLSTPAPKRAPLASAAITSLILAKPEAPSAPGPSKHSFDTEPLVRVSVKKRDADALHALGLVAGVFSGSALRLGSQGNQKRTAAVQADLSNRFGLPVTRFELAPRLSRSSTIVLEVLKAP